MKLYDGCRVSLSDKDVDAAGVDDAAGDNNRDATKLTLDKKVASDDDGEAHRAHDSDASDEDSEYHAQPILVNTLPALDKKPSSVLVPVESDNTDSPAEAEADADNQAAAAPAPVDQHEDVDDTMPDPLATPTMSDASTPVTPQPTRAAEEAIELAPLQSPLEQQPAESLNRPPSAVTINVTTDAQPADDFVELLSPAADAAAAASLPSPSGSSSSSSSSSFPAVANSVPVSGREIYVNESPQPPSSQPPSPSAASIQQSNLPSPSAAHNRLHTASMRSRSNRRSGDSPSVVATRSLKGQRLSQITSPVAAQSNPSQSVPLPSLVKRDAPSKPSPNSRIAPMKPLPLLSRHSPSMKSKTTPPVKRATTEE